MKNFSSKLFFILKGAVILLLFFGSPKSVAAQNRTVTDTLTHAFLPAVSYSSDLGLLAGGIMNRYHYKDGMRPFYSYVSTAAIASTKGLISAMFFIDKPHAFNSEFRISSETYVSRFLQDQFYGIGNYEKIDPTPSGNEDLYLYNSFSIGQEFTFRKPVWYSSNLNHLDVIALTDISYRTPFDNDSTDFITQNPPQGFEGGRVISLGAGLVWDSRDSEFRPSKGTRLWIQGELANKVYGSSFNYFSLETDIRGYTSFFLLRKITFANRILLQHTSGTVPYWKLPYAGGEETLRGYAENRFMDDNVFIYNAELRTWLFSIPAIEAKFGGTLFMDIGNTFSNDTPFNTIFNDLNYTFGFGTTSSFFSEDFIFRGDFGFSDEDVGIYFTAGYMF